MSSLSDLVRDGRYLGALTQDVAKSLLINFIDDLVEAPTTSATPRTAPDSESSEAAFAVGLAAFNAFLQSNVTGPILEEALVRKLSTTFSDAFAESSKRHDISSTAPLSLSRLCLQSLDVDGVSVYPHIPHVELFCLARWTFHSYLGEIDLSQSLDADPATKSLSWMRLRLHVWHYKLLTQPTLGPGSVFNRSLQWTDIPTLQDRIERQLDEVEQTIYTTTPIADSQDQQIQLRRQQFLLEKAGICIMFGWDAKAKAAVQDAAKTSRMSYVLSGALGKRTRFQEKSTSQLVVLARSASGNHATKVGDAQLVPGTLPLNDDTLLENLEFVKPNDAGQAEPPSDIVPPALQDVVPDDQPQLAPLDQIVLLAEATIKDAFSPTDTLTSEEILPFAVRVISDKSTNWQIYTHALLIRSRIEVHRSRTVERGVLQMQAVVDQVIVDSTAEVRSDSNTSGSQDKETAAGDIPTIRIADVDSNATSTSSNKPTSFFPASDPSESAPAHVRLRYIHVLSSPPRWHLESEVAYAWASVGSLVSALEIFKRLRLWAEVALCLASSGATDDPDGRGSGGEEKARAVLRWRLFQTGHSLADVEGVTGTESDGKDGAAHDLGMNVDLDVDISTLKASDFMGAERQPPPPNAPRLFCILGDVENDPKHYERAWELSNGRFARAQKLLGEYYLHRKEWENARDAYKKAVAVNRLSPETWSRLGDINLRLGAFADAAEAFSRAIGAANDVVGGEDARTWSNLGSAFYSLYVETVEENKKKKIQYADAEAGEQDAMSRDARGAGVEMEAEIVGSSSGVSKSKTDPAALLLQSLTAYKRGASIARDNWRIWDNVITLAGRLRPPAISDILQALQRVISIRNTEDAIDDEILRLVLTEGLIPKPSPPGGVPPRGSQEKAICDLVENQIVPLVTLRSELWELVTRERLWRGDLEGAIDAAEKAWRTAMGGVGGATLGANAAAGERGDWLTDREAWATVVTRTDELVSVLENYGPRVDVIGTRWKGKARSALRSVMGKAKAAWQEDEGYQTLENLMNGLKIGGS